MGVAAPSCLQSTKSRKVEVQCLWNETCQNLCLVLSVSNGHVESVKTSFCQHVEMCVSSVWLLVRKLFLKNQIIIITSLSFSALYFLAFKIMLVQPIFINSQDAHPDPGCWTS